MGTRSTIALQISKNKYKAVQCHWDGYLEYNGELLNTCYQDRAKVEKLINSGDLSSLGILLDPTGPHSFDYPQRDVCVFYHRDRGEELRIFEGNLQEMEQFHDDSEFIYIYGLDNKWYLLKNKKFIDLKTALQGKEVFYFDYENAGKLKDPYDELFEESDGD